MPPLFDGTYGTDDIVEILERMEANCPRPFSNSRRLWELRRAKEVSDRNRSRETLLEKAVAMLADNGHMPGWFNQCSTASGIGDSSGNRHRNVDLVHWIPADARLTLVELKWDSDSPTEAVRQLLRYGAAYLFCRTHAAKLPVGGRPAMSAAHVALRVVAPARYYVDENIGDCIVKARESLGAVPARTGLADLRMSLDALAFPESFGRLPFADGAEARDACGGPQLTEQGSRIVAAFAGLRPHGSRLR